MAKAGKQNSRVALEVHNFAGGMNTYSDPSSIMDNELVDCVNFEISLDGSLVSRPPIETVDDGETISFTQRIFIIGSATISGTTYMFGSNENGLFQWSSGSWTLITNTIIPSSVVQYDDIVYVLPFPDNATYALGKWTPSGGYTDLSPSNLKTMMGSSYGGGRLLIYQDRLFIVPGFNKTINDSRLIFSDAGNPGSFSASTQFLDVNPGDGERLMDAIVQDDNLVCLKSDSTYVFTFTSTPADAELVRINNHIGTQSIQCTTSYENAIYTLHRGKVYELVNYNYTCINIRVPFVTDTTKPTSFTRIDDTFLCLVGDRLVVRWYNRLYVYGLRTKTWTRWDSTNDTIKNIGNIGHYISTSEEFYLAGSCLDEDTHTFKFTDGYTNAITESVDNVDVAMECSIVTKKFDVGDPYHFKRLNWWGIDAMTKNDVTGCVSTVVPLFLPTWGDLNTQGVTWANFGTWGVSSSTTLAEHTIEVTASNILRSFFRFPKSVRFRQANFEVMTTTDGSTLTGPVRLFRVVIVNTSKELVPKGIN